VRILFSFTGGRGHFERVVPIAHAVEAAATAWPLPADPRWSAPLSPPARSAPRYRTAARV